MELQQDELVFWTGFAAVRVCSLGSFGGVIRADGYGDLPVIFCRVIVYQRLKKQRVNQDTEKDWRFHDTILERECLPRRSS